MCMGKFMTPRVGFMLDCGHMVKLHYFSLKILFSTTGHICKSLKLYACINDNQRRFYEYVIFMTLGAGVLVLGGVI